MKFTFDSDKLLDLMLLSKNVVDGYIPDTDRKEREVHTETEFERLEKKKLHAENPEIEIINNDDGFDFEQEEVRLNLVCENEKMWITSNVLYTKVEANEVAKDVLNFNTWFEPDMISDSIEYDISADIVIEIVEDEIRLIMKIDNLSDCKK